MPHYTLKYTQKNIGIDLSHLLGYVGRIIPGSTIELKLIEYYRYRHTEENDPVIKFAKYVLNHKFKDKLNYDYNKINTFYDDDFFIPVVISFINKMEVYLFREIDPDFVDIKFNGYIDKEKLKVEFTVTRISYEDSDKAT